MIGMKKMTKKNEINVVENREVNKIRLPNINTVEIINESI
jgi:hypothetical protein